MKTVVFFSIFAALAVVSLNVRDAQCQQITIVAFGDSITAPRKGVVTYSEVIKGELGKKRISANVINSGVPGNTTVHAKARFENDVLAHDPDIVIIQLGTNDSAVDVWKTPPATSSRVSKIEYERNMVGFITELKRRNTRIILVTPAPTRWTEKLKAMYGKPPYDADDPDGFSRPIKDYVKIVKRIGREQKVPVIDLYNAFYDYHKRPGRTMDELFLDGLHPNSTGQRIEADLLINQLRKMDIGL